MINKKLAVAALAAVASTVALMGGAQAQGRDQIRIVGSSTVFPFTSAVAAGERSISPNAMSASPARIEDTTAIRLPESLGTARIL